MPTAVKTEASIQPPQEEDDDSDEDTEDSGEDGELPLATPYPWSQDDYELTLHYDPKRRKTIGTGMVYLKRLTYHDPNSSDLYVSHSSSSITPQYEEASVLSAPAKALLKQLLQRQHKKDITDHDSSEEEDEEEEEEEEEESDDDDDNEQAKQKRRHLPGPRLWTRKPGDPIANMEDNDDENNNEDNNEDDDNDDNNNIDEDDNDGEQQQQDPQKQKRKKRKPQKLTSLFFQMLQFLEHSHPQPVTTRSIIRKCALSLPAGIPSGLMDAKEFLCCSLHFLSSTWKSPDTTQLPTLPLLTYEAVTPSSDVRDLEKRSYQKAYDWDLQTLKPMLAELERFFYNSPAVTHPTSAVDGKVSAATGSKKSQYQHHHNSNPLPWISRVRFCPRPPDPKGGRKGLGETTFLLKGQPIPARMTGTRAFTTTAASSKPATATKQSKKADTTSNAVAAATSNKVVMRMHQGKQLPSQVQANTASFHGVGDDDDDDNDDDDDDDDNTGDDDSMDM